MFPFVKWNHERETEPDLEREKNHSPHICFKNVYQDVKTTLSNTRGCTSLITTLNIYDNRNLWLEVQQYTAFWESFHFDSSWIGKIFSVLLITQNLNLRSVTVTYASQIVCSSIGFQQVGIILPPWTYSLQVFGNI